ncbi:MAG: V-type ATPase subunit subunit G family protein [Methanobacteriaceae archaeon]|jgi:V/A-type H+-transporting ATPase subunit G/H
MMTISEAITAIIRAENDAKKLLEDAKKQASEIVEEANAESVSIMEKTEKEALEQREQIIFEAESKGKNEANCILREAESEVSKIKLQTVDKIDNAVQVVIDTIL